jgi:hypothetical protein
MGVTSTAVTHSVIAGLDPAIHGLRWATIGLDRAVDARVTPGHDNGKFRILICFNRIRPTGQPWESPGIHSQAGAGSGVDCHLKPGDGKEAGEGVVH